jgi:alanine dehydrogenase
MDQLTVGIIARSRKESERRLAIHPRHLERVQPELRGRIFLEAGYGEPFGMSDEQVRPLVGGFSTRERLVTDCDVILLPKPVPQDLAEMHAGQVLWGWPHCVQDVEITQRAIDQRLTVIAFEAMNHWTSDGAFSLHVLHKNNELAGYASVLHALTLLGSTGDYGPKLTAVVVGFGATARGAVTALAALGLCDIDVLTNRPVAAVAAPIHSARLLHFGLDERDPSGNVVDTPGGPEPLAAFLAAHDLIVNCVLQDPNRPMILLDTSDLPTLAPGTLIVDVSCDEGMGFRWARPTSFEEPILTVGDGVAYYGVDHSPSYLWNSATWEISEALLPHIATVLGGPEAWAADPTISRAVEIEDGRIHNADILRFQSRAAEFPHPRQS